jgi:parallel beta-helix repeat protein
VIILLVDGITVDGFVVKNSGNSHPGINVASSSNTIINNDISYNGNDGIYIEEFSSNIIKDNILAYNGRDGLFIKNANNNIISGNTASFNSRFGFYLKGSSSSRLEYNLADKNKKGIYLDHSNNNVIKGNQLINNGEHGIYLTSSSANNITENDASFNYNGVSLKSSSNNLIFTNIAHDNKYSGMYLEESSGNSLYLNNLSDNLRYSAFDNGYNNHWYAPEIRSGNLYSDYDSEAENCTDLDGDRICDNPYSIPGGTGVDLYPLTTLTGLWGPKYQFIEIWTHQNGVALNGTPAMMMIDFPTYYLEDSYLVSYIPVEADPSVKTILGEGISLSGDLGGGAASALYPVSEIPCTSGNLTILSIDEDIVTLDYQGQRITLGSNESWEIETESVETDEMATLRVTTKTTIWNHGRVWLRVEELI